MHEGSWTIAPCSVSEVSALADALGVTETTAAVLLRRGYADEESARAIMRQLTVETRSEAEWEQMRQWHPQGDEQIRKLWEHPTGAFERSEIGSLRC